MYNILIRRVVIICCLLLSWPSLSAQEFRVPITVSDGENERVLTIGIHPDGSDEYVQGLDIFAPPTPPPGIFDARIVYKGEEYFTKILDNKPEEKIFYMRFQLSSGGEEISLSWDNKILPESFSFTLTDDTRTVDMREDSIFVLEADMFGRVKPVQIVFEPNDEYIQIPGVPYLISPADKSIEQPVEPLFIWNNVTNAESYHIQVSVDTDFNETVIDAEVADTTYQGVSLEEELTYYWRVKARNETGTGDWSSVWEFTTGISTYIDNSRYELPEKYLLHQNYPNPFNPSTTIRYALPNDSYVRLEVFNMLGQHVSVLVDEEQPAGIYEVVFDGSVVPSGVYVYRITAFAPMGGEFVDAKRLVSLK